MSIFMFYHKQFVYLLGWYLKPLSWGCIIISNQKSCNCVLFQIYCDSSLWFHLIESLDTNGKDNTKGLDWWTQILASCFVFLTLPVANINMFSFAISVQKIYLYIYNKFVTKYNKNVDVCGLFYSPEQVMLTWFATIKSVWM